MHPTFSPASISELRSSIYGVRPLRGFTLIELLTVIAIIGILAAILNPTVARVRGSARTAQSLSNLRQIGIAAQLYMDENKGWMPDDGDGNPSNVGTAGQPGSVPWYNALPPYVGEKNIKDLNALGSLPRYSDKSIFVCPRAVEKTNRADSYAWRSYAPTWLIDANASGSGSGNPTNRSMVKDPTRTVMFSESTFHTAYDLSTPTPDYVTTANPNFLRLAGAQRHDGKTLVTFFDGSVRPYTAKQLEQQYNERNTVGASVRWNPKLQSPNCGKKTALGSATAGSSNSNTLTGTRPAPQSLGIPNSDSAQRNQSIAARRSQFDDRR